MNLKERERERERKRERGREGEREGGGERKDEVIVNTCLSHDT